MDGAALTGEVQFRSSGVGRQGPQTQERRKPSVRSEGLGPGSRAGAPQPLSGWESCPGGRRDGAGAEPGAAPLQGAGPSPSITLPELPCRLLPAFRGAWRPCSIWQLDGALIRGL